MRLFPPQGCVCADDYLLVGLGPPLLAALAPRGLRGELRTPIEPVVTDGVADLEAEPRLHGRFLGRGARRARRRGGGGIYWRFLVRWAGGVGPGCGFPRPRHGRWPGRTTGWAEARASTA